MKKELLNPVVLSNKLVVTHIKQLGRYDWEKGSIINNKEQNKEQKNKYKKRKPYNPLKYWVCKVFLLVRIMGLEPIRRLTHAPQTCLSAYSSTLANINCFSQRHIIITKTLLLVNKKINLFLKNYLCGNFYVIMV